MNFNIRVYGLLIYKNQVLISDEKYKSHLITKFPGGGLEVGEGLLDCLKREFKEECGIEIEVISHFYTTDFYQKSAFDDSQLISIYYLIDTKEKQLFPTSEKLFNFVENNDQCLRFQNIESISDEDLTFPIDQYVLKMIKNYIIDKE